MMEALELPQSQVVHLLGHMKQLSCVMVEIDTEAKAL
jgi:hypothetical protein